MFSCGSLFAFAYVIEGTNLDRALCTHHHYALVSTLRRFTRVC